MGMENLSWPVRGWIAIVIGCCFILGSAAMLYRGDVGHVMPITRENDPIFFWSQIATIFAVGVSIIKLGVYSLSREDDDEN
jgi:hypothetical protein